MTSFKIAGFLLILIGILSGVLLLASPFGITIQGSVFMFWVLYALCYVGGFTLYALGSPDNSAEKIFRAASVILLTIGLLAVVSIFLNKINIVKTEGTLSHWLLFILCTISGALGELAAQRVKGKTIRELKIP